MAEQKVGAVSSARNRYTNPIDAINTYKIANERVARSQDTEPLKWLRPFGIGNGETYGWSEGNQHFGFDFCNWHVDKGGYSVPIESKFQLIC